MRSFRSHRKSVERKKVQEDLSNNGLINNPDDLKILEEAGFITIDDKPKQPLDESAFITRKNLNDIEKYADRLFAKVGIDVEFTRHFLDRVNDERNRKQITTSELTRLFKQSFKKYGKQIAKLGPAAQAVINDMRTDINMPFVLEPKGKELELIAKTVMRKKDFKTTNTKLSFESYVNEDFKYFHDDIVNKIKLPPPPTNDYKEIAPIRDAVAKRTDEDVQSIRNHDEVPFYAIQKYCEKEGLEFHIEEIERMVEESTKIILHFKNKFDRTRPWDVDPVIKPLDSKTNKTPAYPSGHAAQSILVAKHIASKHPEHSAQLMSAAKECGWGRVQAGFHYVSDYEVGNFLGEELYKHMDKGDLYQKEAAALDEQLQKVSENLDIKSEKDKIAEAEADFINSLNEVNDAINAFEELAVDLEQDPSQLVGKQPKKKEEPKKSHLTEFAELLEQNAKKEIKEEKNTVDHIAQYISEVASPIDPQKTLLEIIEDQTRQISDIRGMMATTAGGGEVLLGKLDDVDESTAKVNDKFLKYNSTTGKWVGSDADGGGTVTATSTTTFTNKTLGATTIAGHLIPDTDESYDLGSSTKKFNDLYLAGSTIKLGDAEITSTDTRVGLPANTWVGSWGPVVGINATQTLTNKTLTAPTFTGTTVVADLDISGDVDIDGTLETDALTIAGVTLAETIADTVGAMVGSNTETGIAVTYDDSDNTLDFVVGTLNQDTTGNAATATALETARTIGGTSFDGTANIAVALSATATALETARTIHGVSFDGTANIDLTEVVQDTVGAMFSSNTETGITVTYQDADGTIDLVVGTLNQDTTGNAATATALETARTIGGVSFDGSANINLPGVNTAGTQDTSGTASKATVSDSTANTNFPVVFHDESNGLLDDTGALRYNPSTGELLVPKLTVAGTTTQVDTVTMEASNAIVFEGATADAHETTLTVTDPTADRTITLPNATGTVALTSSDITGNAATATALETARTIHGVSFDGTANIDLTEVVQDTVGAMFSSNTETGITVTYEDGDGTIDLVIGTLNQDTTGNAATATALETARTIHGVSFDGTGNIDLSEVIQDTVGAMFSSNTETGIAVSYEDGDGTIDLVVGTLNQNTTGSAATLTTGRTIGMTGDVVWTSASFNGSANVTGTSTIQANAVETSMINADAVTGAKIADDSINSEHYVDGSIDTAHIADDQVTEAKMADDAIGSAQLKSLSTLLIKNSSGTTLKTFHGAGA